MPIDLKELIENIVLAKRKTRITTLNTNNNSYENKQPQNNKKGKKQVLWFLPYCKMTNSDNKEKFWHTVLPFILKEQGVQKNAWIKNGSVFQKPA